MGRRLRAPEDSTDGQRPSVYTEVLLRDLPSLRRPQRLHLDVPSADERLDQASQQDSRVNAQTLRRGIPGELG